MSFLKTAEKEEKKKKSLPEEYQITPVVQKCNGQCRFYKAVLTQMPLWYMYPPYHFPRR